MVEPGLQPRPEGAGLPSTEQIIAFLDSFLPEDADITDLLDALELLWNRGYILLQEAADLFDKLGPQIDLLGYYLEDEEILALEAWRTPEELQDKINKLVNDGKIDISTAGQIYDQLVNAPGQKAVRGAKARALAAPIPVNLGTLAKDLMGYTSADDFADRLSRMVAEGRVDLETAGRIYDQEIGGNRGQLEVREAFGRAQEEETARWQRWGLPSDPEQRAMVIEQRNLQTTQNIQQRQKAQELTQAQQFWQSQQGQMPPAEQVSQPFVEGLRGEVSPAASRWIESQLPSMFRAQDMATARQKWWREKTAFPGLQPEEISLEKALQFFQTPEGRVSGGTPQEMRLAPFTVWKEEQRRRKALPDPWEQFLKSLDVEGRFAALSPRERGFSSSLFRPRTRVF